MDDQCARCGSAPPNVGLRERPSPWLRGIQGADPNAPTYETVCAFGSGCMAPDSVRRVTGIGWAPAGDTEVNKRIVAYEARIHGQVPA